MIKMKQQRNQGRLRTKISGAYRFANSQEWLPCNIIDFSTGGIALEGKRSFYAGDKIEVKIQMPERLLIVKVEITNQTGKKAGGRLMMISDADRVLLQEILDAQFWHQRLKA